MRVYERGGDGMTLEEAVEVLNREGFLGGEWSIHAAECYIISHKGCPPLIRGEFEAIAIAEKYERERLPEAMPERRTALVGITCEPKQSFRVPIRRRI